MLINPRLNMSYRNVPLKRTLSKQSTAANSNCTWTTIEDKVICWLVSCLYSSYGILSKSTCVQNPPDKNLYFRYLFILQFFLKPFLFIFLLFLTIIVIPNPYPRLVSGSPIWLGGFWTGGFLTCPSSDIYATF